MGLMDSKRGLVVGIANDHSYAYHIAESLVKHGAECLFTHLPGDKMLRRVSKAIGQLDVNDPWLESMDAGSDEDLDRVFDKVAGDFGSIDFLVHSIAFADRDWLKDGAFAGTPRTAFTQALDISAYTYLAMANRAAPLMSERGGSMIAMSYYGAQKTFPGYNVMGVAKAALESTTRYTNDDGTEVAARKAAQVMKFQLDYVLNGCLQVWDADTESLLGRCDAFIPTNIDLGATAKHFREVIELIEADADRRSVE